jgi:hypothetical protein
MSQQADEEFELTLVELINNANQVHIATKIGVLELQLLFLKRFAVITLFKETKDELPFTGI